jgi:hypothetical protein
VAARLAFGRCTEIVPPHIDDIDGIDDIVNIDDIDVQAVIDVLISMC